MKIRRSLPSIVTLVLFTSPMSIGAQAHTPLDQEGTGDKKIELIRAEYKRRHQQESVLRMDRSLVKVWGADRRHRRPAY